MIPYIMENQKNAWNHQPAFFGGESTSILRSYSRDFEGKSGWDIQVFQVHPLLSMAIPGSDLLEVPTIYKAFVSGLNFIEYHQKIWPLHMVLS